LLAALQPNCGPRAGPVFSATDSVGAHPLNRIGIVSVTAAKRGIGKISQNLSYFFEEKKSRKFNAFF
jgi:hypothetical protein